jgi:Holliday junction resolvase RusA-like endonuclease
LHKHDEPTAAYRPHPRAPISMRMSADDFRAMQGRSQGLVRGVRKGLSRLLPFPARGADSLTGVALTEPAEDELTQLPYQVVLPFLPPSVNGLTASVTDADTGRPKRVLTKRARTARRSIETFVKGRLSPSAVYELHITVELPALTKDGKLRKIDLTNRVKFLEDCVARCLGIDDRQFFRVVLNKLHAGHERTLVTVMAYERDRMAA